MNWDILLSIGSGPGRRHSPPAERHAGSARTLQGPARTALLYSMPHRLGRQDANSIVALTQKIYDSPTGVSTKAPAAPPQGRISIPRRPQRGPGRPKIGFSFAGESQQNTDMTKLLEQAVAQLRQLSETQQDEIARLVLAELESDQRWDDLLAQSPQRLSTLADEAWSHHEAEKSC